MAGEVVVGVDAGGTTTRCVAATLRGRVLARGTAAGANPHSSADPTGALASALHRALAGVARDAVVGGVIGIAGAAEAGYERARAAADEAWRRSKLPGTPRVGDDIAVAFAAGSTRSEGAVLIAGTGAVAAYVRDGAVTCRCDGYGWLLGDEGSAVWIALAGLRAALAAIDGRARETVLHDRLGRALAVPVGDAQRIIEAVHARPPADLGALAPIVSQAANEGDAVAATIVAEAADRLLRSLAAVAAPASAGDPVVLAGALLRSGPVADAVRAALRERLGLVPSEGTDGALGAAGLALRGAGAPVAAHAALLRAQPPGGP